MFKENKKKNLVLVVILIIYTIIVFTYSFFPKTSLNKVLSTKIFLTYFYSFPVLFGCVASILSILVLIIVCYKNKIPYYKNLTFIIWILILATSIIFVVCGTGHRKEYIPLDGEKTFKIVEWNTANNLDEKNIYTIFGEFDADIAVFPELEGDEKGDLSYQRLRNLFLSADIDFDKYEIFASLRTEGNIAPVTIVVKKSFAQYDKDKETPMTLFGTIYLKSKDKNIPDIVGVHTAPPLPTLLSFWNDDLDLISKDIVKKYPNAIIIGDFNATMRHGSLNEIDTHEDALNYLSIFQRGTWNIDLPSCFRTTIDHILIPKDKYLVKNIELKDLSGSDHICVFAELALK